MEHVRSASDLFSCLKKQHFCNCTILLDNTEQMKDEWSCFEITHDLLNEAIGLCLVRLAFELSEPDVELVCVVPTVEEVELETLHIARPRRRHRRCLQPGRVTEPSSFCARVHEVSIDKA